MWSQREVTMYGKILLTKTFILAQFNFLVSCLPSPSETRIKEIDKMILSFVRSFRSAQKLSKDIIQLDKNQGGLNLTLLKEQIIGLKISWIIRLISNSNQGWKDIVNNAIPLKNNEFWRCNIKKEDCKAVFNHYKKIPFFWKDVIVKWANYNFGEPSNISDILGQVLWFNSFIKNSNNEMICYTACYNSGIFCIKDLICNNKLATFIEISRKFPNARLNFINYYAIISMIPARWKNVMNNYFTNSPYSGLDISNYNINYLKKFKKTCAAVVKISREKMSAFPIAAFNKWQQNVNSNLDRNTFLKLFQNMYWLTKDTKLLIFQYKLLHRQLITNRNLNLWDQRLAPEERRSDLCYFCKNETEHLEHLLYNCPIVKQFWSNVFTWIAQHSNLYINFTMAEILLCGAPDDLSIFNLIFIIGKKYIFDCKNLDQNLNIYLFKYKVKTYFVLLTTVTQGVYCCWRKVWIICLGCPHVYRATGQHKLSLDPTGRYPA